MTCVCIFLRSNNLVSHWITWSLSIFSNNLDFSLKMDDIFLSFVLSTTDHFSYSSKKQRPSRELEIYLQFVCWECCQKSPLCSRNSNQVSISIMYIKFYLALQFHRYFISMHIFFLFFYRCELFNTSLDQYIQTSI